MVHGVTLSCFSLASSSAARLFSCASLLTCMLGCPVSWGQCTLTYRYIQTSLTESVELDPAKAAAGGGDSYCGGGRLGWNAPPKPEEAAGPALYVGCGGGDSSSSSNRVGVVFDDPHAPPTQNASADQTRIAREIEFRGKNATCRAAPAACCHCFTTLVESRSESES